MLFLGFILSSLLKGWFSDRRSDPKNLRNAWIPEQTNMTAKEIAMHEPKLLAVYVLAFDRTTKRLACKSATVTEKLLSMWACFTPTACKIARLDESCYPSTTKSPRTDEDEQ